MSVHAQALFRVAYGALLWGTLLWALPHWRRFFMSERWGGYAKSQRDVNFIQNPIVSPVIACLWFASAALIALGWWSVWAALLNLLLCRYFFVSMRWKGVLRGMGAPGFMTYWLAAAVFLLEYTLHYAPGLRSLALLVLQVDFAFIMLSAGIYKLTAGYARNHGMEGGMVNPEWGYWWRFYIRWSPHNRVFQILNQLAWATEVGAGILMLIPATRFIGGLLILFSFIFIATQIRLGLLCEMVILGCLLFFHPGSYGDQLASIITQGAPLLSVTTTAATSAPYFVNALLSIFLWSYLILLPLAHAGLFYNFYGRRRIQPALLQRALEIYTNFFGIIIWRVFSVDIVNFFIRVHRRLRSSSCSSSSSIDGKGERKLLSRYGLSNGLRYSHVGEAITVTSLFTTLKYYPSDNELFRERLLRYAATVPCPSDSVLDFEYVSICKAEDRFDFVTIAEYTVDPAAATIEERIINEIVSVRAAHALSPIQEGARPGTYAPLKS